VILATPTTLIALLRAVAYGWTQQALTENAERISQLGRELYERIATVTEHWGRVGKNLGEAVGAYNKSVASLETRVLVSARKFRELKVAGEDKEIADLNPVEALPREVQAPELLANDALPRELQAVRNLQAIPNHHLAAGQAHAMSLGPSGRLLPMFKEEAPCQPKARPQSQPSRRRRRVRHHHHPLRPRRADAAAGGMMIRPRPSPPEDEVRMWRLPTCPAGRSRWCCAPRRGWRRGSCAARMATCRQARGAQAAGGPGSALAERDAGAVARPPHCRAALLRGEIPPACRRPALPFGRAGTQPVGAGHRDGRRRGVAELFDREGMALAAMEAASLQRDLAHRGARGPAHRRVPGLPALARKRSRRPARPAAGAAADEVLAWRIACIERGIGRPAGAASAWPVSCPDPWVISRLLVVLEARGVELFQRRFRPSRGGKRSAATGVELPDAEAECLAAAAWARPRLAAGRSRHRLRIAVGRPAGAPRICSNRPRWKLPCRAMPSAPAGRRRKRALRLRRPGRRWRREPLVDVALRLLQISASIPRRVAQAGVRRLALRRRLVGGCRRGRCARLDRSRPARVAAARSHAGALAARRSYGPPRTTACRRRAWQAHLDALLDAARAAPRRQSPSAWGAEFAKRLEALGWPGQRPRWRRKRRRCDDLRAAAGGLAGARRHPRPCRCRRGLAPVAAALPRPLFFRAARAHRGAGRNLQPGRCAGRCGRWALGDGPQRRRVAAGGATESLVAGRPAAPRRHPRGARRQPRTGSA
jgi:hypothetical protein